MTILGINGDLNSTVNEASASLVVEGKVVAAVAEERMTRIKMDGCFPVHAIREVLRIAGIGIQDVDKVALSSLHPAATNRKYLYAALSTFFDTGIFLHKKIKSFTWNYLYNSIKTPTIQKTIIEGKTFEVFYNDHHKCHAAGAYYCSPFDDALIITLDGGGDGLDGSVYSGRESSLELLFEIPHFQSPGTMYSALTHDLGFKRHRHEGKITGLAAYGNPDIERLGLDNLLRYNYKKHRFISKHIANHHRNLISNSNYFYPLIKSVGKEDLAAATQFLFEREILNFVKDACAVAKLKGLASRNVCLAGGCFANVKMNQLILEMKEFDNVYVFPAMGDDGLSTGAGLLTYYEVEKPANKRASILNNVYLGADFSDDEIRNALAEFNIPNKYCDNIEKLIAQKLSEKKVVCRFNGRMEYGPRALGNRSVIAAPFDKTINTWLNKQFQRTEFMPFAPSMIEEYAGEYLENYHSNHAAPDFMTITYKIRKEIASKIPAVVHIDETARPQIVKKKVNPSYHRIIEEFYKITGVAVVLNTSYNMHEEPIVYTPADAIRSFLESKLDFLAIGNFWVEFEAVAK